MEQKYTSFEQFWPFYLEQHSKPLTRRIHVAGTLLLVPLIWFGIVENWRFLILLPVVGYGFAWFSHAFVEHNKPATFKYPLWSLRADFRMCYRMLLFKELN